MRVELPAFASFITLPNNSVPTVIVSTAAKVDNLNFISQIPQEKLNLMKLEEVKETPWNKRLIKSRKKLLSQIAVINDLMERIKRLMNSSSLSFKKSIALVHSAHEMAASPYHSNGRVMEGKTQGRMFSMDV